jgi:hypothetical protein
MMGGGRCLRATNGGRWSVCVCVCVCARAHVCVCVATVSDGVLYVGCVVAMVIGSGWSDGDDEKQCVVGDGLYGTSSHVRVCDGRGAVRKDGRW